MQKVIPRVVLEIYHMLPLKLTTCTRVLIYFLKVGKIKLSSVICYHRNVEFLKDKIVWLNICVNFIGTSLL